MAHRFHRRYRPAWRAVVAALEATIVALTFDYPGGGHAAPGPDFPGEQLNVPQQPGHGPELPDPDPEQPGPGPEQPGPGPEQPAPGPEQPVPAPEPPAGIQGTYTLIQINNSAPGQLVTLANPDGILIGLYRFDAATTLTMDALQTFTLTMRYSDDKDEHGFDDHGEFKLAGQAGNTLALVFSSADYEDQFSGVAVDGTVAFQYDFDDDGRMDTTFGFQRVN